MNRRDLMRVVGGALGLSTTGDGSGATDADVRAAVEQSEVESGSKRSTRDDNWPAGFSFVTYDLGPSHTEDVDVHVFGGAHDTDVGKWEAVVDTEIRAGDGRVAVFLSADDARVLAWDLLNAADSADAETAATNDATGWDDLP